MPLLGSIMTIDAGSPTGTSSSVFQENMTWARSTAGSTSSTKGPQSRALVRDPQQEQLQLKPPGRAIGATGQSGNLAFGRSVLVATGRRRRSNEEEIAAQRTTQPDTQWLRESKGGGAQEVGVSGKQGTQVPGEGVLKSSKYDGDNDIDVSGTVGAAVPFDNIEDGFAVNDSGPALNVSIGGIIDTLGTFLNSSANETYGEDALDTVTVVDGELLFFGFGGMMEDIDGSINGSLNESLFYPSNGSLGNETYFVMGEGLYPSGYSLPHIILASILATLLMIVIVIGNMLVIIAIATEKALKNIQNWFIASLAVADFFLGLVIMPFSLANEIMGYWIFGYWWCDIHSAMDVLLCTASIMNLCLISLDRFWSITQAVAYLKKRTPARAALMIALVWLLSALVCIPPLLGWKRPTPEEEYPKCKLSEDIGYVLYSALGSFYIPSCIMVFVYIRIYFAAKARARRGIRKQPRPQPAVPPESPDIRQTSFTQSTPATDSRRTPGSAMENVATIENLPVQIPIVTCDFASDVSTSEADPGGGINIPLEEKDTLKVSVPLPMQKSNLKATLSVNGDGQSGQSVPARCRAPSVGIDVDMVSEFDPSSSDSGVVSRCAVVKPLKLRLCQPIFGRKNIGKLKREHGDSSRVAKDETMVEAKSKPRDPEREKRRLARKKEKRATLILGFIMGSFIACWLPFFVLYIVKPLFPNLEIPTQAFVIAFWLGYMNSALNPFIYTVFNKDFRRAFRRILFK